MILRRIKLDTYLSGWGGDVPLRTSRHFTRRGARSTWQITLQVYSGGVDRELARELRGRFTDLKTGKVEVRRMAH